MNEGVHMPVQSYMIASGEAPLDSPTRRIFGFIPVPRLTRNRVKVTIGGEVVCDVAVNTRTEQDAATHVAQSMMRVILNKDAEIERLKEPTEDMVDAAFKALPADAWGTIGSGEMYRVLKCALAAAAALKTEETPDA